MVINYEYPISFSESRNRETGYDLLIITPDEFGNDLLPFKEWKEKTGIITKITTESELVSQGYEWIADDPYEDPDNWVGINRFIREVLSR